MEWKLSLTPAPNFIRNHTSQLKQRCAENQTNGSVLASCISVAFRRQIGNTFDAKVARASLDRIGVGIARAGRAAPDLRHDWPRATQLNLLCGMKISTTRLPGMSVRMKGIEVTQAIERICQPIPPCTDRSALVDKVLRASESGIL